MVLDPLTDVSIGVFVAVCVSRGQLMVDILGHSEGRKDHEEEDEADRQTSL